MSPDGSSRRSGIGAGIEPSRTEGPEGAPPPRTVSAFGVDYFHLGTREGGDLYVTPFGRPHLPHLLPESWYQGEWYAKCGERLRGASGAAYRVRSRPVGGKSLDMVVKFSRVARDVFITVDTSFPDQVSPEVLASARFNSPLEEFGLLMELRRAAPEEVRILTQHPLAIYAPPEEFELWQLGREPSSFQTHRRILADDQSHTEKPIDLDIRRLYVLLYGWIKGRDAEECFTAGEISEDEMRALSLRVIGELDRKGFRVLDNKPKHFILRSDRRGGGILRRRGELVYGLVDFELLQRTSERQHRFKAEQSERYWRLQSGRPGKAGGRPASTARTMTVFGVTYVFGRTPDGGKLWVVGDEPELFDYFLPERWRRTPRVKLSPSSEIYRTRTRDNIDIVYRQSRIGTRPPFDPVFGEGKRILDYGFNSPFEEVALAERLRPMGVPTVLPRAIFRTGHRSVKAAYFRDDRRYVEQARFMTPEDPPEPVLSSSHDYYTLWDYYRGIETDAETRADDIRGALEQGLATREECDEAAGRTRDRLRRIGFVEEGLEDEFGVWISRDGGLRRDGRGRIEIRICIDSLTAYERGLLGEEAYGDLVRNVDDKLRAVDYEKLARSGKDLLLSMNPDGLFGLDETGKPRVTLCNFELIRGLYRP
ncbi:MAG TPA: hypothetical protein VNI57_02660, partial [Candidatus Saccharimonadales bacterium]|nr:hypothetical protein [Candidatus Saccharimonadales bacterium]